MRDRLFLPLVFPTTVMIVIAIVLFSTAKILLDLDPRYATVGAILIALYILGVAALLANGPRLTPQQTYLFTALPAAALIAVGMYVAARPEASTGEGGTSAAAAAATSFTMTATDNAFSMKEMTVPAGAEITFVFDNKGAAVHNWHVLNVKGADGQDIATKLLPGGQQETLKFAISQPGTYNYQCDVHPTEMVGKLTVAEASAAGAGAAAAAPAGAAGGAGAEGATTVVATDNKFDKTAITVKAGAEASIDFQNKGSAIHNLHVFNVKGKDGQEIQTKLLPGGQQETIKFTIDKAGTYDFKCDVHPVEMVGKLTVQ